MPNKKTKQRSQPKVRDLKAAKNPKGGKGTFQEIPVVKGQDKSSP